MNSILQCILATAPLTKYFRERYKSEKTNRSTKICSEYSTFLNNTLTSRARVQSPSNLKSQIAKVERQFRGNDQEDS